MCIRDSNYTWVLSRLAIELDEMPYQYEKFSVQTWVENVYRLFTDRNFAVIDKDGKKIGYARSVWAMINLNTRKPADLLALHGGSIVDYICDEPCPIEKPSRIKVTSNQPVATLTAKYSDIDINGHVNSIRYIEHILDLFPIELYQTKRIRRFEMAYVAESYFGDELSFFCDEVSENEFHVEVKKNGSEVAVSYTHLDVYKRQVCVSIRPLLLKNTSFCSEPFIFSPLNPSPYSKALAALILSMALPKAACSLPNTGCPNPIGHPLMTQVSVPPMVSPSPFTLYIRSAISFAFSGSGQRTSFVSIRSRS